MTVQKTTKKTTKKPRKKPFTTYQRSDGTWDYLSLFNDENAGLTNQLMSTLHQVPGKVVGCSTGLLTLDYLLNGGLPVQRINYFFGPNQSGKSTNMYCALREAQRQKRFAILADAERSLDPGYLKSLGVKLDSPTTVLIQPLTGQDVMLLLKRVLKRFVEENIYFPDDRTPLLIFDSLAALVPEDVYAEKESLAMLARLLSENLKALNALIGYINGTIIAVNQIRSNIGVIYGPKTTEPGGWAVRYYPSTKIKTGKGEAFTYADGVPGHYTKFTLTKTRHCAYWDPQLIALRTGEGFNQMDDLMKMMVASRFLLRPTNQSYELNSSRFRKYLPNIKMPQILKRKNSDMEAFIRDQFTEYYFGMRNVIDDGAIFGEQSPAQETYIQKLDHAEQHYIARAEQLADAQRANNVPTVAEGLALVHTQGEGALQKELDRVTGTTTTTTHDLHGKSKVKKKKAKGTKRSTVPKSPAPAVATDTQQEVMQEPPQTYPVDLGDIEISDDFVM